MKSCFHAIFDVFDVDRRHHAVALRHAGHAAAAEDEDVRILGAAEPLQRRVAERVDVAGLRAVGHRRLAHAPGRRQQVRERPSERRREEASELEARGDRLLAPHVAVVEHGIGADRIRLRRPRCALRLSCGTLRSSIGRIGLPVSRSTTKRYAVGAHRRDELCASRPAICVLKRIGDIRDVGFPDVVLDRLVVPLQLAGLDVERDDRAEIQVGARALVAGVLRHAVAGAEVDQAELGIRGADEPDGAAADLICIRWSATSRGRRLPVRGRRRTPRPSCRSCRRSATTLPRKPGSADVPTNTRPPA